MKNKKAALVLALIAVLAVSAYAPRAYAQEYNSESDFHAVLEESGVKITKYLGYKQEVRIPPRIDDFPVTSIGEKAFYKFDGRTKLIKLTSVTIPNIRKTARFT